MDPQLTHAFEPVVQWLERVAQVIRPKVKPIGWQQSWDKAWTTLLPQWCEALGLGYPRLFIRLPEVHRLVVKVFESGRFLDRDGGARPSELLRRRRTGPERGGAGAAVKGYWSAGPSTWVYRSMARYLRRHVVRESDRWVAQFQASGDPLHVAQLLRSGRHALTSYADMLWSHRIEPGIEARRWPYRKVSARPLQPVAVAKLLHQGIGLDAGPGREPARPLSAACGTWMKYQIAAAVLLALWHDAMARAVVGASTGLANWEEHDDVADLCGWVALRQPQAGLRFLTLSIERRWLQALPRTDKAQRQSRARLAHQQRQTRHWQTLQEACRGSCLSWTPPDGWSLAESCAPGSPADWRLHRLLGIPGVRPRFWLFTSGALFVARLCSRRLQATGRTPKQAIEALRQCARQYVQLYGTQQLGDGRKPVPPLAPLKTVDQRAQLVYQMHVANLRFHLGFWGFGVAPALPLRTLRSISLSDGFRTTRSHRRLLHRARGGRR